MDPFVRIIYFAYNLNIEMSNFEVIDIKKNPKIKEKFDPKSKGKYFLITKNHPSLEHIESEGSIQDIIERIEYENKNWICK